MTHFSYLIFGFLTFYSLNTQAALKVEDFVCGALYETRAQLENDAKLPLTPMELIGGEPPVFSAKQGPYEFTASIDIQNEVVTLVIHDLKNKEAGSRVTTTTFLPSDAPFKRTAGLTLVSQWGRAILQCKKK